MSKNHSHLGNIVIANVVKTAKPNPQRARNIVYLLAGSVALMMTGFGIIMPVFARRLTEFGSGVQALGLMTTAFALTQFLSAPFMGYLADRFGRKPLILISLFSFGLINIAYLLAQSTLGFIVIRGAAGLLTAGLFPAAMGIVADIVDRKERGQWIGIVMGGYGAGLVFGPVLGGFLYDGWGFAAPFALSAALGFLAFGAAAFFVPETRPQQVRYRETLHQRRETSTSSNKNKSLLATLPKPLYVFGTLLFLDFLMAFSFTFIEPEMVFYVYDQLNWTTVQFGSVVGVYGLAMVIGQTGLGQLSDKFGRKPIIIIGILLNATLYPALAFIESFWLIMVVCVISGLGNALISPAASAFYLDITPEQHRSRVLGLKESGLALGTVLGPLLVVVVSPLTSSQTIFIIAGVLILLGAVLALFLLKKPDGIAKIPDAINLEITNQRNIVAQASLRGLVMRATTNRKPHLIG